MSRYLRQSGQLARLARLQQPYLLQRTLKPSIVARSLPTAALSARNSLQVRPYSSKKPTPEEDKKANENNAKQPEKKDEEQKEPQPEDEKEPEIDFGPLPDGWVFLSSTEIEQLKEFAKALPPAQRDNLGTIMQDLKHTGVPAEVRDLLGKLKEGPGRLTMIEKGKLLRSVVKTASRVAEYQTMRDEYKHKGPFTGFGKNETPDEYTQDKKASSAEEQNSSKSQSEQSGEGKDPKDPNQQKQEKGKDGSDPGQGGFMRSPATVGELLQTSLVIILSLWLWDVVFGNGPNKEITWQEMRTEFIDKGLVEKFVVTGGQVKAELRPEAQSPNGGKYYYFTIGSVDSFERNLNEAQDELGIRSGDRIPVSYENGGSTIGNMFLAFGPTLLFIGLIMWTQRSMGGARGGGGMFNFGKSKAKKFNAENAVKVKFADVAGLEEAKTEIMEFVSFLKQPQKFEKLGAKIPRGAILAGPPGTGKTLLAKATAGESGVPFFSVSGSEFVEMFVGVGPSRVRDLFAEGRKNAPCIIFIDEIDAIGRARQDSGKGFGGNDEREATLNQILTEMDGFNTREQVVVLAGTNRADVLDKALMRPGRFDRHIYIDRPTMKGRKEIFDVYLKKIVTNEDKEHLIGRLATLTPGFSGADISNVVNEAALIAARANADDVKLKHFEQAIERVIGGLERKSLVLKPQEKKTVAYHEAGHAICGWFLEHADPLLKVSIIPRGQGALGYAQYLPQDAYLMNVNQLMDRMAMTMGGRVSEELHFPTVTTGGSDDFKKVTQTAQNMVTQWGMSDKIGPVHFENDPNRLTKPFAESTARDIDAEVHRIVEEAYTRCRNLLTEKKHEVGLIAQELLKKEVLVRDDMVRILGKRPFGDNEDFEKYFSGGKDGKGQDPAETDDPEAPSPTPAFKQLGEGESR